MPPEDLRRQVVASMCTAISRGQAPLHRRSQQAPPRLIQNQIKCSICSVYMLFERIFKNVPLVVYDYIFLFF